MTKKEYGPVGSFSGTTAVRPAGTASPHDDAPERRKRALAGNGEQAGKVPSTGVIWPQPDQATNHPHLVEVPGTDYETPGGPQGVS